MSKTPIYRVWCGMRRRCNPKFAAEYPFYAGRGISVCERWSGSFEAFLADMGPMPGPEYSIDRINPDGDYAPENCRWLTHREQCLNRRSNVIGTMDGQSQTITQWADQFNLPAHLVFARLARGWTLIRALETKQPNRPAPRKDISITVEGQTHLISEWARKTGIAYGTIWDRLKRGDAPEDILRPVPKGISHEQRAAIAVASGSFRSIGRTFGVNHRTVSEIKKSERQQMRMAGASR
jgi:hypothetical protein